MGVEQTQGSESPFENLSSIIQGDPLVDWKNSSIDRTVVQEEADFEYKQTSVVHSVQTQA